jgi:hypothetical protein
MRNTSWTCCNGDKPCNPYISVSLFRYGLDYVQMAILRLIGFGKKEEFKKVLAILRKKKPDRARIL